MSPALGRYAPRYGRYSGVRAGSGPVASVPVQNPSTRLGSRQRCPCPVADELALLVRHGRIDPEHEFVGAGHVGCAKRHPVLQQLRQVAKVKKVSEG